MLRTDSLREMTKVELQQKKRELEEEIFNLNMRRSLKQLDNPLRLRLIRREVAMVKTVLREDELNITKLAEEKTSVLPATKKSGTEDKK